HDVVAGGESRRCDSQAGEDRREEHAGAVERQFPAKTQRKTQRKVRVSRRKKEKPQSQGSRRKECPPTHAKHAHRNAAALCVFAPLRETSSTLCKSRLSLY